jgi:hypothetical protein
MANDRMYQFRYSYEANVCDIFMNVSFGASGAPTLTSKENYGITSIAKTGTGAYTITLKSKFNRLMLAKAMFLNATAPAAPGMYVVADNSAASTPTVQVQFLNASGVATNPGSGEVLLLQLSLKNSSI